MSGPLIRSQLIPMMRPWTTFALTAVLSAPALACGGTATGAPDAINALDVQPRSVELAPDDSVALKATALDAYGVALPNAKIAWYSADTTVATVAAGGEVHLLRAGVTRVFAIAGRQSTAAAVVGSYAPLTGVRLYAHRGFASAFPENTLVSTDSALARGADGIEADVQLTSDSTPVIIHDATVDRTTNGTGAVQNMTLAQVRALDACSKKGTQWAPCQIPLASELMDRVRGRGYLILDLKGTWPTSQLHKLIRMVRERGMVDATMVTSFEMSYLTRVRNVAPRVMIGWLRSYPTDPTPALDLGNAAIFVDEQSLRQNASAVPAYDSLLTSRKSLLGAFTIYTASVMPTLRSLGVKWFVSDIPLDRSTLPTS